MQKKGIIGIVLGAAKVPEELVPVFGSVPATLIPINGKPVIFLLLEHFKSLGIREVYVSVGYMKEKVQAILDVYAGDDSFRVIPVPVDISQRPGTALLDIVKSIPEEKRRENGLYIQLADTLLPSLDRLSFDHNFIMVSGEYSQSEYWCVIERDPVSGNVTAIYDKQKGHEGQAAAVGAYYLADGTVWNDMREGNYEISHLLEHALRRGEVLKAREGEWFDLGHLEKYYQAKAQFLSARAFNDLKVGSSLNTVVKRSTRNDILTDEILWYLNLPKDLAIYAPRIIDYNVEEQKGEVFAEFEFYGYPSLANLWLYGSLSFPVWKTMIDRVFAILGQFRSHLHEVKPEDSVAMYAEKTNLRVEQAIRQGVRLARLFAAESVRINRKEQKGWPFFQGRLKEFAALLYDKADHSLLHGDMCFSNILFDLNYGMVKLVDPRGKWGSESFYGDIKYDVAKLRHSAAGLYDHIVQGHVNVSYIEGEVPDITLRFPLANQLHEQVQAYVDQKIAALWDLNKIKLIEGLLFISMIPLHTESEERQIAMFSRGIGLLNEAVS